MLNSSFHELLNEVTKNSSPFSNFNAKLNYQDYSFIFSFFNCRSTSLDNHTETVLAKPKVQLFQSSVYQMFYLSNVEPLRNNAVVHHLAQGNQML